MPGLIRINNLAPHIAKTSSIDNRLIFKRVPSVLTGILILRNVITAKYVFMMRYRLPVEIHSHENIIAITNELASINEMINLRVFREARIYDVLSGECCLIFIEPIRHKDRNIVAPSVSRRGGK